MLKKLGLTLGLSALVLVKAQAHDLWIHASDFTPKYNKIASVTSLYAAWGHIYPVEEVYPREANYEIHNPNEKVKKIDEKLAAYKLMLKGEGNFVVSGKLKPYYWTSYYDKKGKRTGTREAKTGLKNIISSKQYNRFAKAIISVGDAKDSNYSKVLGHDLEIITLNNPNKVKANGGEVEVKVLFKGKPLAYHGVYATYAGFSNKGDFSLATKTNIDGIAKIKVTNPTYWKIKTDHTINTTKELQDKCDNIYYAATLTFQAD